MKTIFLIKRRTLNCFIFITLTSLINNKMQIWMFNKSFDWIIVSTSLKFLSLQIIQKNIEWQKTFLSKLLFALIFVLRNVLLHLQDEFDEYHKLPQCNKDILIRFHIISQKFISDNYFRWSQRRQYQSIRTFTT